MATTVTMHHRRTLSVDDLDGLEDENPAPVDSSHLHSSQELSTTVINPLKLMALLRVKFGVGRYEVKVGRTTLPSSHGGLVLTNDLSQVAGNMYNIQTPRRLSIDEIARCRSR